ncbi:MAG: phosphate-binding protein, partial [Armatimonadota bacterium]
MKERTMTTAHKAMMAVAMVGALGSACAPTQQAGGAGSSELSGTIAIDGSSTVFPISEAVAEEFQKLYPNVRVT